ncbi:GIY-YIG nuclease family protein [Candidatus Formimonas warabiya]|uniref:ArsR family transcriptional regulator n=1 Tax=Formimonas warabiya TaxID=1761012 RepID=A0A3G1KWI8_FORW1|nr:GIY-YIG nuclease family protein [Candidatus Formimonas warabiya]ATW26834.1 ArsR family transcriptional regulator [Candidatus Formimonas warabiya]
MTSTSDRKKELRQEYRKQKTVGGVYKITNTVDGRFWLYGATNIQGHKSRFEFAQKTNACVDLKLQKEWDRYGAGAFAFEILEELEMKDTQTTKEFKEDIKVLEEIWAEKLHGERGEKNDC